MNTLATLTASLEALCDELDTDAEIPQDLLDRFVDARLAHEQKVGAYVSVIGALRKNQAFFSERAELLKRRAKTYERMEKAIIERLVFQMKAHPNLPWVSDENDKLKLRANPESLQINVPLDKRTVAHILSSVDGIDPQFITVCSFHCLNTDAVKSYLKSGKTLGWAALVSKGEHLRIS